MTKNPFPTTKSGPLSNADPFSPLSKAGQDRLSTAPPFFPPNPTAKTRPPFLTFPMTCRKNHTIL